MAKTPTMRQLPPSMLKTIRAYEAAREVKRKADAASRSASKTYSSLQNQLLNALRGVSTAQCGSLMLTIKRSNASEAALTLRDESKVPWDSVSRIIVGNKDYKAADIIAIYGGKAGSRTIVITKR